MAQVIERNDIFGRIGKAIGQGAGEQAERNTLSSGLERIAENKDLSQIQRHAQAVRLPGYAEHAGTFGPLLNTAAKAKAKHERVTGQQETAIDKNNEQSIGTSAQIPSASEVEHKGDLTPISEIKRFKQNLIQPITQRDIDLKADELTASGEEPDPDKAEALARQRLEVEKTAQDTSLKNFREDLNGRVAKNLQIASLGTGYEKIAGEIQQRLIDEGDYLNRVKGMSSEAAALQIDNIAKEIGKATRGVAEAGELPFGESKLKIEKIKSNKKHFDKYGFGEQYNDLATAALKTTNMETASILDPLENKSLLKELEKHKYRPFRLSSSIGKSSADKSVFRNLSDKEYDQIIDKIDKEDNILSIEHWMRDNRVNIASFNKRLNEKNNYDKLTERQQRELDKPARNSFMGDVFFRAFK